MQPAGVVLCFCRSPTDELVSNRRSSSPFLDTHTNTHTHTPERPPLDNDEYAFPQSTFAAANATAIAATTELPSAAAAAAAGAEAAPSPTRHKKGRQAGHQEAIGMEKAQGQAETPSIGIQPFLPSRTGADSQEYGKPRL